MWCVVATRRQKYPPLSLLSPSPFDQSGADREMCLGHVLFQGKCIFCFFWKRARERAREDIKVAFIILSSEDLVVPLAVAILLHICRTDNLLVGRAPPPPTQRWMPKGRWN